MVDATNGNDIERESQSLSRRAAKKAKRKLQKAEKKREALRFFMSTSVAVGDGNKQLFAAAEQPANSNLQGATSIVGGKATRARLARQHDIKLIAMLNNNDSTTEDSKEDWEHHRPQGGAPILSQVSPKHIPIVQYLENKEHQMRIKGRGERMSERLAVEVDCHGSMDFDFTDITDKCGEKDYYNFSRTNLRGNFTSVSMSSLLQQGFQSVSHNILRLNLSRNELWNISADALQPLAATLLTLDISRNWFEVIPESIATTLSSLKELKVSHNLLKPNALNVDALKEMKELELIDLRFNQKCGKQTLLDLLQSSLGTQVEVKLTVTYPPLQVSDATASAHPDRVGESPAVRDATLLRSQLEPWSTMALRRRLVADFGEQRTKDGKSWADEDVSRGQIMEQLLILYQDEAREGTNDENEGNCRDGNCRLVVHVTGIPIEHSLQDRVLHSLREFWESRSLATGNRERPSIAAENYMILCSPTMFDSTSQKAAKAAIKLKKYEALWNLGFELMNSVDPLFASQYTAVAVTHNFFGSPHIDKQNTGPFYGFSCGNFEDGTGSIMVECSARVIAKVNTKNCMAKVDGRYPHWVGPYDKGRDRYSLIYYRTDGEVEPIGPAVFTHPHDNVA